jgi:uncharacterized protein (DUF2252 family)
MNGNGILVFDVNDFDEAWVAPFTWDLKRLAASLALVGFAKAMSDEEISKVVSTCVHNYAKQVGQFAMNQLPDNFALTRETTCGKIQELLLESRLRSRVALLDKITEINDYDRRFKINKYNIALDASTREKVDSAFKDYLTTIPQHKQQDFLEYNVKDICEVRGAGIGSVGFAMYSILVEGPTESLENDRIISMKVGQVPSASRVTKHDEKIRSLFQHHGHRTVLSQRALQAYSDPWIGHTILDGVGQFVSEYSPYTADLEWDDLNKLEDIVQVAGFLGQAVAKIHCVSDVDSDANVVPFSTDNAIHAVLKFRENDFVKNMTDFALAYGNVVRDDYRLFVDAFRNHLFPGL